jgi:hypothetical protein
VALTFSFPFVYTPPFYSGTPLSTVVPDVFPLAIDGRPYMIDQKSGRFARQFEPRTRDSVDQSTAPGEAAINPGGLWRRGQVSWHAGAGQKYADVAESQDYRFYKSKGVNPWTKGQLTLLNDTKVSLASAATTSHMVAQDGRVYVSLNGDVKFTTNPYASSPTWTDCTGEPGGSCAAMATDGYKIYLAFPSDGVRQIIPNTSVSVISTSKFVNSTDSYYMLGFAKNYMFGAHDYKLRSINSSGSPADVITPGDQEFRWVGVATGQNAVYAAGYSGKKSLIYKITIQTNGNLDTGVVALELPSGEVVTAISGYLGFILIGTDKGVRFCSTDNQSNLVAGPLIPTSGAVTKFTSTGRFSYFTWSNYDGVSSGLGRMDLSVFTSTNLPAYATDLMYGSTKDVLSVVTFDDKHCFVVSEVGVVAEDTANLVASGSIETGTYRWGIPDAKFVAGIDTRSHPLLGSITTQMALDNGDYANIGTWDSDGDTENSFYGSDEKAIEAMFKFTLTREDALTGPTMTRWMARAYAAPFRSEVFSLPLLLHKVVVVKANEYYFDVEQELENLRSLVKDPRIVTLQINNETVSAILEDMQWTAIDTVDDEWAWQGTATVTMRSVQD